MENVRAERINTVCNLFLNKHLSLIDIARELNVSTNTIQNDLAYLKNMDYEKYLQIKEVRKNHCMRAITFDKVKNIGIDIYNGMSRKDAAKKYNCSKQAISSYINKYLIKVDSDLYEKILANKFNTKYLDYIIDNEVTYKQACEHFNISEKKLYNYLGDAKTKASEKYILAHEIAKYAKFRNSVELKYINYIIENKSNCRETAIHFNVSEGAIYKNLKSVKSYFPLKVKEVEEIFKVRQLDALKNKDYRLVDSEEDQEKLDKFAVQEALYILKEKKSLEDVSQKFNVSITTVKKGIVRLREIEPELYEKVKNFHKQQRCKKLDDTTIDKIAIEYYNGVSSAKLSKMYKLSMRTIGKYIKYACNNPSPQLQNVMKNR